MRGNNSGHKHDSILLARLEGELKSQADLIARLSDENMRLKAALKAQLEASQEDRTKQNRMTELLYILRKKHVDIDRIYEEHCETPGLSKKESFRHYGDAQDESDEEELDDDSQYPEHSQ